MQNTCCWSCNVHGAMRVMRAAMHDERHDGNLICRGVCYGVRGAGRRAACVSAMVRTISVHSADDVMILLGIPTSALRKGGHTKSH